MTVRLVRSTSEMEGRVTELWTLVDEADQLDVWPAGEKFGSVGRPTPRQDGRPRAAGSVEYTVDVKLPGMLHAAVLRCPVANASVVGLELEAARALPGVRAVIGPESGVSHAPPYLPSQPLLVADPSYAGQAVAVVAADTPEQARAAVAAITFELEQLPHILDPAEAVYEQRFAGDPLEQGRGDVDAAMAAADATVEVEVETPDHLQVPLEPHAAVARWDADQVTVWLSTQGMFAARQEIANAFGVGEDRVRVIAHYIGGAFGAKQGAGFEGIAAVELARVTGRPVRVVNDRHEEFLDGGRRAATRQTVRLGARQDGTLVAVDTDAIVDQGQGGFVFLVGQVLYPSLALYECENVRALGFPARTNRRGQNAYRGPGMMEGITALEQAMEELAIELDLDPLELRRRNHVDVDQLTGMAYSGKRLLACYDRAAELAGWESREALRQNQPDGLLRGMGCASQIWGGAGGPPAHSTVRIDSAGRALVLTGIQDIGTGTMTAARMVAAEELGLPLHDVWVVGGDTAPNVYGPVAGGSMTVPSVMPAVRSAATKAKQILLQLAGDVFEIAATDLSLTEGRLRSADGAIDAPVTEVTGKLGNATIDASGSRGPNPSDVQVRTFGCQIAQVAVDPAVGEVRVERVVAVHDVGRIINPLGAVSQVHGGVLQAMAHALAEEVVLDPTLGTPVNAYLDEYKVPTMADLPEILVDFIDLPDVSMPNVGSRGLGEPPIIPTAAAIANAFRHATGRRCRALPMTRARVLEALA